MIPPFFKNLKTLKTLVIFTNFFNLLILKIRINLLYEALLLSYEKKVIKILSNGNTEHKSIKNHPLK